MTEETPLSKVIPVLSAALLCDTAAKDPSSGKYTLIGIFDRILAEQFPTTRPLSIFFRTADGEGFYKFKARFVLLKSSGEVELAEMSAEIKLAGRLLTTDFALPLPPLPIPEEGRYEFQIIMNGVTIGQTGFWATPKRALGEKQ